MLQLDKFQSGKVEKVFVLGIFSFFILIVFCLLIVGITQFQRALLVFQNDQEERKVIEHLNEYIYANDTSETIEQIEDDLKTFYNNETFTIESSSNSLLYITYTDSQDEVHSFYFFLHSQKMEDVA